MNIPERTSVLKNIQSNNGTIAAILPIHYPRSLFEGLGLHPIEVWAPKHHDLNKASSYLQTYTCSVVRMALSFIKSGSLDIAKAIVVPHGCDSLQGLGSILKDFHDTQAHIHTLYIPKERRDVTISFLADELQALAEDLCKTCGLAIDLKKIEAHLQDEQRSLLLLQELFTMRDELNFSNIQFYRLLRSREYLSISQFNILAETALTNKCDSLSKKQIGISGVLAEPLEVLELCDKLNLLIVFDDTINVGRRLYQPSSRTNIWEAMAEMILSGPPDSTLGHAFDERAQWFLSACASKNIQGIIFNRMNFCEPEYFYHPTLQDICRQHDIPTVEIHTNLEEPHTKQLETRLEAFAEML